MFLYFFFKPTYTNSLFHFSNVSGSISNSYLKESVPWQILEAARCFDRKKLKLEFDSKVARFASILFSVDSSLLQQHCPSCPDGCLYRKPAIIGYLPCYSRPGSFLCLQSFRHAQCLPPATYSSHGCEWEKTFKKSPSSWGRLSK